MRLPRSLHWRIALAYTVLIFLSLGIVSLYLVSFVRDTYVANLQASLDKQARFVSDSVSEKGAIIPIAFTEQAEVEFQAFISSIGQITSARVTVIGADGRVIADSLQSPSTTSIAAWTQRGACRTLTGQRQQCWHRLAP